jgi:catechol 2,3-dioxygenase-like lactoylglutathione lyase family enzyme
MAARFAGLVLRATDKHASARFYECLGLVAREHEHGGPRHYEVGPPARDSVLEVYAKSAAFGGDAVMVDVDSLDAALAAVLAPGEAPKAGPKDAGSFRFAYVTDPDGRSVMPIETRPDAGHDRGTGAP